MYIHIESQSVYIYIYTVYEHMFSWSSRAHILHSKPLSHWVLECPDMCWLQRQQALQARNKIYDGGECCRTSVTKPINMQLAKLCATLVNSGKCWAQVFKTSENFPVQNSTPRQKRWFWMYHPMYWIDTTWYLIPNSRYPIFVARLVSFQVIQHLFFPIAL